MNVIIDTEFIIAFKSALLPALAIPCILLAYTVKMLIDPSDGTLFLTVIGLMAALAGYVGGRLQNIISINKLRNRMAKFEEEC